MIYQASLIGTLKTILFIIAMYYIAKTVMRLAAPYLMKYAASKMEQKMKEQFGGAQQKQQQKEQTTSNTQEIPTEKKKVGDYIEFEELD